ncbi:MAG: ATP-binding cassette domain-containing protein [Chitinophagaceae bacterium]|nr:ATP-binding cassette domain-containing protein [Chitinophagaceae bacterium]
MNHDTAPVLTTSNLSFSFYKGQPVLDNINITVPAGSIYGFLGPNGAGKTTTMRLLTGLLPQQGDHIQFFNQSLSTQLPNLFHRVGCLIETPSLYLHLSGLDNLRLVARMKDIDEKKAEPVLTTVGLQKAAHRKAGQYSLGMKQRLAIAIALLNDPQLLMLDEPVNGLDPNGMVEMRELMKELNREKGITIFISSHLLHEVEKMCTHIGIIHKGKIRFEGKISELSHANGSGPQIILTVANAEKWLPILTEHYSDGQVITSDKISISIKKREDAIDINRILVQAGAPVAELKIQDNLEDWFMQITQN